jgi:hypothetical protein
MMLGTAVVGLALGMVRLAQAITDESDLLLGVAVGAICALIGSLIITLPVLAATLWARRLSLSLPLIALLACGVYAGLMIVGTILSGNRPSPEDTFGMAVTVGSLYICLVGVFLVFRAFGYLLRWGRRKTENADHRI